MVNYGNIGTKSIVKHPVLLALLFIALILGILIIGTPTKAKEIAKKNQAQNF